MTAEEGRVDCYIVGCGPAGQSGHPDRGRAHPAEFETAHIPGAINLPLDQVDAHLGRIVADAGGHLLLIRQSGNRATQACTKLAGAGLTRRHRDNRRQQYRLAPAPAAHPPPVPQQQREGQQRSQGPWPGQRVA
jgi:hypothetical protein